jgi:glucokinase
MDEPGCALVADIGGTNARFLCAPISRPLEITLAPLVLPCADYPSFDVLLNDAVARLEPRCEVREVGFAVAGPLADDEISMVNLPWVVRQSRCVAQFATARCTLLNDFEAIAHLAATDVSDHLQGVGGGRAVFGCARVVLGPGTGLGVAAVAYARDSAGYEVVAGEGGNVGFAPGDAFEGELAEALRARGGRVFVEQVLSGSGLRMLYGWMHARTVDDEPRQPSAESIIARARDGEAHALAAVDRFLGCLGSHAGDLALTFGARGGVLLTGGVMEGLLWRIEDSPFRERFESKGRHRAYVSQIPTSWLLLSYPGLRGAFARVTARNGEFASP